MVDDNDEYSIPRSQGPAGWEDVASYYNFGPWEYTHTVGDSFQDYPYENGEQMGLIKPDISAPGFPDVTTTDIGGVYINFGNTSAAAPHVSERRRFCFR